MKAKEAQQKIKDEVVRILLSSKDGPSLTIDGHEQLVSRVKLETEKAQAAKLDVLEAASRMSMLNYCCDFKYLEVCVFFPILLLLQFCLVFCRKAKV